MEKVLVKASTNYNVYIGKGILEQICGGIRTGQKLAVVADETVAALYMNRLLQMLRSHGHEAVSFTFPAGEASKSMMTLAELLEWLAEKELTREDMVIALGGGVTGDLAGFASSVYLRGIPYMQVPTTFLAAIDSSVGGKTAVDLQTGKNLAGSFYQPQSVVCDVELLSTLSGAVFAEGIAEAVKYGILGDPELFQQLESGSVHEELENVVCRCVRMKRDIVEQDEFDTGQRQLLNLGHTFGHCVEKLSHYQISHGNAVSIGLAMMARAAAVLGYLSEIDRDRMISVLKKNDLPVTCPYEWQEMMTVMKRDKKRKGDILTLVVPTGIGTCVLQSVSLKEAGRYLELALKGGNIR